jgi:RNA polymerase sigma-70 factor (ECF subfamily)
MSALSSDPETRPSLLIRLRNTRDEQAWAEFIAVYEPVIYRMTKRRNLQDADAREVVQEVLISVAGAIDRFDFSQPGSFRGWISRITRNATIDRLRTLAARREWIDGSGVIHQIEQAGAETSLADEFERDRREQLFRWAASQVRSRTGELNWMAFWKTAIDGESVESVAEELQISQGAVYVARCRILKRIRELVHERISE